MSILEKIFSSITIIILGIIFSFMMGKMNDNFKETVKKKHPELFDKEKWFFSDSKKDIFRGFVLLGIIYFLIQIWIFQFNFLAS